MKPKDFEELCKIYAPNLYKNCLKNEEFMNQPLEPASETEEE